MLGKKLSFQWIMRIANSIIMCNSGGVLAPSLWRPSEDDDPGCFSLLSIQFPECLLKVSAAVNEDKQSLNLSKYHSCFAGINIIPSLSIHHPGCHPELPGLWHPVPNTHLEVVQEHQMIAQKGTWLSCLCLSCSHPLVAHSCWHVGSLHYLHRKISQDCILYY